ncbi:MAG: T9SS type A sorting domain-containing protein, partial [Bacteroidota bacterium]|nr:T9SS type A sorting domain-containing protein [Bacteroidota bacterium]
PVEDLLPGTSIENIANIYFDFNEPVITDPSILVVTMSTGLGSNEAHDNLKIYPQPNNGSFTIIGNTEGQFTSIQVFSVDGRELIHERVAPDQRQFQLNGLANGRYVVRLIGDDLIETYSIPLLIQQ